MNMSRLMSRLFITLVAAVGLVISSGCGTSKPAPQDSQNNTPVETDMNIVVPDSTEEP